MKAISVAQLNNYIKQVFEAEEMLHNIEVIGEISGIKKSGNAVYFTLKDAEASIPCACFVPVTMFADGTKIVARGTVNYWNKAGKISFIVNKIQEFGLGGLMLQYQQLFEKLKAEGLFDDAKKKSIPSIVKRIGVVTSKTGAVIHDICTVARRRNPSIDIAVVDSRVQGDGAENEIVRGIEMLNNVKNIDVIIVARGGGSMEDLQPFNTEVVARAVFTSKIPIVSAVGHETDHTLIDMCADLRAPTPSVAAELCVREVITDRDRALQAYEAMRSIMLYKVDKNIMLASNAWFAIKNAVNARVASLDNRLEVIANTLEERNPLTILRRGFAKPNIDLNNVAVGTEFELQYLGKDDKIKKGVAEWKSYKN